MLYFGIYMYKCVMIVIFFGTHIHVHIGAKLCHTFFFFFKIQWLQISVSMRMYSFVYFVKCRISCYNNAINLVIFGDNLIIIIKNSKHLLMKLLKAFVVLSFQSDFEIRMWENRFVQYM